MSDVRDALIWIQHERLREYEDAISLRPMFTILPGEASEYTFAIHAQIPMYVGLRTDELLRITHVEFIPNADPHEATYGTRYDVSCKLTVTGHPVIHTVIVIVQYTRYIDGFTAHNASPMDIGRVLVHSRILGVGYTSSLNQVDIDYFTSLNLPGAPW